MEIKERVLVDGSYEGVSAHYYLTLSEEKKNPRDCVLLSLWFITIMLQQLIKKSCSSFYVNKNK